MEIIIKIVQFLLSFSLLVIVHEFGHFMFARIFGVRVETFQLFFGRPLVTFTSRRGTVYGIGCFPFGGFVKLAGMIDESLDTQQMQSPPAPDEFRSKPAWQRLLIMVGGVLMNVVLAFCIYVGLNWRLGENYLSTADAKYGYVFSQQAQRMGFRNGDQILSVNGKTYEDLRELHMALLLEPNSSVSLLRYGDTVQLVMPDVAITELAEDVEFLLPRYPFRIGMVVEGGGADKAGIVVGDRIVALNGEQLPFFDQYIERLPEFSDSVVTLGVERTINGIDSLMQFAVEVSADGKIGAQADMLALTPVHTRHYSFLQSVPAGARRIRTEISNYWKQLKLVFMPKTKAYKSLGGPIAIGSIFPTTWNWVVFWEITAMLSIVLAVMNILPIPALDGGHVLFLLVEVVSGRKPGDKFIIRAQMVGMAILFALIIFATTNDIFRYLVK